LHSHSGEILLNMADLALYQSKAQGRNRSTIYSSGMEK
jgi:PleD family two-component response regulator